MSLENGSLTKSQKNFSSISPTSNNKSPVSAQRGSPVLSRRREVTEEEAERSEPLSCFTVFLLLCVLMFFCQSFCDSLQFLCVSEGLFSRWTRQQSLSSAGTEAMPRDNTLTRQRSNVSLPVKERYPSVPGLPYSLPFILHGLNWFYLSHAFAIAWTLSVSFPLRSGRREQRTVAWSSIRKRTKTENVSVKRKLVSPASLPSRCLPLISLQRL